jgi:hypothetical protein
MRVMLRAAVAAASVAVAGAVLTIGCDTLFPEFAGKPPDAGLTDGGSADGGDSAPRLQGTVCILSDLRDYRSCSAGATGVLRITVEETRQMAMTDVAGHFTLPLSQKLTTAIVAAVDPQSNFAPTIVPIHLQNGVAVNLAIPVVAAQTLANTALQNGVALDPQRGTLVGWAVDPTGTPLGGVTTNQPSVLYDGAGQNELTAGSSTKSHGTVALLVVTPTTLTLSLTPPPTAAVRGDTFTVPIRAGALTATTLVLPPR